MTASAVIRRCLTLAGAAAVLAPGASSALAADYVEFGTTPPNSLSDPRGVAVDEDGFIYVADRGNDVVRMFDPHTLTWVRDIGVTGMDDGELAQPTGVAVSDAGHPGSTHVFVADPQNESVQEFDDNGTFVRSFGAFELPVAVAVDPAGNVSVADDSFDIIARFAPDGTLIDAMGKPGGGEGSGHGEFTNPLGVDAAPGGDLLVSDGAAGGRVQRLDPTGIPVPGWPAAVPGAAGVDHDLSDRTWVASTSADEVTAYAADASPLPALTLTGGPGSGQFNSPYGVAVDCVGNVFVVDAGNDRVQRYGEDPNNPSNVPPCVKPANTTSPSLSGNHTVGSMLTLDTGTWSGAPPPSISQRFQRCRSTQASSCSLIPGQTGTTYTVTEADRNHRIRAIVVATNFKGTAAEPTDMTPLVPELPTLPVVPDPPPLPDPIDVPPLQPPRLAPTVTVTGLGTFTVVCPRAGALVCDVSADLSGRLRAKGKRKARQAMFASADGELQLGQTGTFRLVLTRRGRQLVRAGARGQPLMSVYVNGALLSSTTVPLNKRTARQFGGGK